mgnify:CR=1 FL=1
MGLWDVDKIEYVGRAKGPKEDFAFHYYDADKVVAGKKMKDWLRFGVAWWHTFNQELVDPFGTGTAHRPYYKYTNPMDQALAKVDYAFELFQKLGVEYFCFHDRDIAPEGDTLRETNANLDKVVDKIDENMKSTGVKLLWNTSSLFTNPRFVSGAATSPFADIYAYAGGQLKKSLEIGKRLGAENYVFWGGREGYENLWNTEMKRETDHIAKFFHMCADYAKEIGFEAQFLIEPKPKEPTLHQYDFDAATAIEYNFPFGFKEVEGIHSRTDFDLGNHQKFSGRKIQYFDPETGESYVPYVVETSIGVDRMFLQVMSAAYTEQTLEGGDSRVVLKFPPALAPVKVAVLPLVKKDGMPEVAQKIVDLLKYDYNVVYDEKDSVGKRYRRQDAVGTPFCVTVDGQTLEDGTVTIRHRDTMAQERVKIESLHAMVDEECSYRKLFRTLNL